MDPKKYQEIEEEIQELEAQLNELMMNWDE